MRRFPIALVACLATWLALATGAPAGAQAPLTGPLPFDYPRIAAADNGEMVVVWLTSQRPYGIRAAIGTPGRPFGVPVTLGAPGMSTGLPAVAMDAAGDVVVVWESVRHYNCSKADCQTDSLGVFAAIRPANGSFGAPLRLSPEQTSMRAEPLLAMNRGGDWVVVMRQGAATVVVAGRGATAPSGPAAITPGLGVGAVALDEAGNATLSGVDGARHPAIVVRGADGSIGELTILDDAQISSYELVVGVGPQGHAVAVWPGGGFLRSATRMPGGSFGTPVSSAFSGDSGPRSIGVDAQGRTLLVMEPRPVFPAPFVLRAARGTVAAVFGEPVTVTDPARDSSGPARFAMASGGNAVLGWVQSERFKSNREAKVAIATDAGPFSSGLTLTRGPSETVSLPDVAIDGAGRSLLAWTSVAGDLQRIHAAALSPAGVAGPTVVAEGRPAVLQEGRATALPRQAPRIERNGTIRALVRCVSPDGLSCAGSVHIDALAAPGRKRTHVGLSRFLIKAGGESRPILVRVSAAARRAARRGSVKCTVVTRTKVSSGTVRHATSLTLRRSS